MINFIKSYYLLITICLFSINNTFADNLNCLLSPNSNFTGSQTRIFFDKESLFKILSDYKDIDFQKLLDIFGKENIKTLEYNLFLLARDGHKLAGEIILNENIKVLNDISSSILQVISAIDDLYYNSTERLISGYFIAGSFAKGELKLIPNDIDFMISVRRPERFFGTSSQKLVVQRIESINQASKVQFHLNYLPSGYVFRIGEDFSVMNSGEIYEERILESSSNKIPYILIDLTPIRLPGKLHVNSDFIKKLYTNLFWKWIDEDLSDYTGKNDIPLSSGKLFHFFKSTKASA